jgi:hypothetical protein
MRRTLTTTLTRMRENLESINCRGFLFSIKGKLFHAAITGPVTPLRGPGGGRGLIFLGTEFTPRHDGRNVIRAENRAAAVEWLKDFYLTNCTRGRTITRKTAELLFDLLIASLR